MDSVRPLNSFDAAVLDIMESLLSLGCRCPEIYGDGICFGAVLNEAFGSAIVVHTVTYKHHEMVCRIIDLFSILFPVGFEFTSILMVANDTVTTASACNGGLVIDGNVARYEGARCCLSFSTLPEFDHLSGEG